MKKNKIFLLITLVLLLLSVSYAAEVSDDTASDDTPTNTVQTSTQSVEQSVIKEEQDNNKEIKKTATSNKTTKTAKKTYEVTDSNSLFEALCEDTYDTLTININENIEMDGMDFQENINKYMLTVDNEGKTLIIEGNGNTINGESTVIYFRFLTINSGSNVIIKNIKITNFDSRGAGAIDNYGNLRIINSTLNNNKAGYGGAIYNNEGSIYLIFL